MDRNFVLKAFKKEVLAHGAEACLPVNLSDSWIDYLDEELSSLDCAHGEESAKHPPTCSLAAVLKILFEKHGQESLSLKFDDLYFILAEYRVEIGLEIVSRRAGIHYNPATLSSLFTNRIVECWKES
ncbi:hypothetical protein [Oryzomonas rubra]|uniref:Uncharacterized protein n=1 Tax=Oryzomonas rubra TaxID=2509454 RepID=A0A5A9X4Y1_9BACT|nr:hypothetical protein [Oryzomonas rubra]KAA0888127.1 hypothetical protein ET418_17170 [Oryzomonas rubra]